jgi:hypothetical protein
MTGSSTESMILRAVASRAIGIVANDQLAAACRLVAERVNKSFD